MLVALFGGMSSIPMFWFVWFLGAIVSYYIFRWYFSDRETPGLLFFCLTGWDFMWIMSAGLFIFFSLLRLCQFIYEKANP